MIFQSTPSAWRETADHGVTSARINPISIHSLRMEGDLYVPMFFLLSGIFQSTPSAWRETYQVLVLFCRQFHFNPLPPHGGRLTAACLICGVVVISIHSLRMEGDVALPPPHATLHISIHSLRMEGD